jgi:formamidopyrimidine-DNA glycosylase
MPELPEVEITVRLLDRALAGAQVAYARAPGINALKSFAPPLDALAGREIDGLRRRGKQIIVEVGGELALLMHLMSAGRLQLFDKAAGPRDRTSRLLVGLDDGRELRLREFGTKQAAWVKLVALEALAGEESLTRLGPEAWPSPPADLGARLSEPRPLHAALRDQRVIAGIGRSWVDEILWNAKLSPFKRGSDLHSQELAALSEAIGSTLAGALEHYEQTLELPIPDKLPMPLAVHRHEGEPCPRCGARLEAVNYEDYVMSYCPSCQTDGRVLKDRRLSRLLK